MHYIQITNLQTGTRINNSQTGLAFHKSAPIILSYPTNYRHRRCLERVIKENV